MPKRRTADKEQEEEAAEAVEGELKQEAKGEGKGKGGGPKEDNAAAKKNKVATEKAQEQQEEEQEEQDNDAAADEDEDTPPQGGKKAAAKKTKAEVVLQTERDALARKPAPANKRSFKVLSWNVNGLNGILNGKTATLNGYKATNILLELVAHEGEVDVIFLQETKLQDCKCQAFEAILPGYVAYWSCSKTKKGYAGVAAFVKEAYVSGGSGLGGGAKAAPGGKQQTLASFFAPGGKKQKETKEAAKSEADSPVASATASSLTVAAASSSSSVAAAAGAAVDGGSVSSPLLGVRYGYAGDKDEDEEGRVVTLEFRSFWLVGVYVANSGMKLERLKHRLSEFNPMFQAYLARLNESKPVVVMGDFNVAPLGLDCYNSGAKHLSKVPGLTPEEREAHATWLGNGWIDTFRAFHPEAKGAYTYWNVKTNARPENKGLRLDFSITAAQDLGGGRGVRVHDSFILHEATVGYSDHAPIGVVLEVEE